MEIWDLFKNNFSFDFRMKFWICDSDLVQERAQESDNCEGRHVEWKKANKDQLNRRKKSTNVRQNLLFKARNCCQKKSQEQILNNIEGLVKFFGQGGS